MTPSTDLLNEEITPIYFIKREHSWLEEATPQAKTTSIPVPRKF